jgi:hypothetical protein
MGGATMGLGCGGAVQEEAPSAVLHQPEPRRMAEAAGIEGPEATVREMKACVEAMHQQSAEPFHAFQYNLGANEQGKVLEVKLHDATLRDASLEACFKRVLAAMSVPKDALQLRSSKPFSGGESTYARRADIGIVQAAAAPIAMLPIILVAGGVTILVGVTIIVVAHAIDDVKAEQERCKQVLAFCIAKCTAEAIPSGSPSGDPFFKCRKDCLDAANCWGVKLY